MPRPFPLLLLAATALVIAGCSGSDRQEPRAAAKESKPEPVPPPRITQLYVTTPTIPRGEKGLLCYGVENAETVWLSPPRQELSAAMSRCVEIAPGGTTTYKLTAEGRSGESATREVTVTVGAAPKPRARIVEVTVSALTVNPGDAVSICYQVENAASVQINPINFRAGSEAKGCAMDQPRQTTTYTVVARSPEGEDKQPVTVKVR